MWNNIINRKKIYSAALGMGYNLVKYKEVRRWKKRENSINHIVTKKISKGEIENEK